MTDAEDIQTVRLCADKLNVGFLLAGMSTEQVVTCMLGFLGGRVPSSRQEMKARLLGSYATLVCPNIKDALSDEEERRLYEILKRHAQKLHQGKWYHKLCVPTPPQLHRRLTLNPTHHPNTWDAAATYSAVSAA